LNRSAERLQAPVSYRVATSATRIAPSWTLRWVAGIGGFIHYWISPTKRRDYIDNAAQALRGARRCPPWRAFQNHALNVLEFLRAAAEDEPRFMEHMALHGGEHIDQALRGGRGLILATFHAGNWELAGLMLASKGYPITTVAGEQLRSGWSEPAKALKRRYGIRVVEHEEPRLLYRDLQANRAIVLHIDGDLFTGGHDVAFLGRTLKAPRGPAHLSRVLRCPVAFAYCRRTTRTRLGVFVEPALEPPVDAAAEVRLTQTLISRVENCVLEDPGQWCIFRRLASGAESPMI
jgi:lauroyl/myristoyl acyltransferase